MPFDVATTSGPLGIPSYRHASACDASPSKNASNDPCSRATIYIGCVTSDDDAPADPATSPENVEMMRQIHGQLAEADAVRERQHALEVRLASAIPEAVSRIEQRVLARAGLHAREEDLRGGLADGLHARGELVLTEAKLQVPGWTTNLGGFDLALVVDDSVVLGETKWADGNLYESMWDLLKLGSALSLNRVDAAVAIYGAPAKRWQQAAGVARLFEDREVITRNLILALPREWQINLDGSSAKPHVIPILLRLRLLTAVTCEVLDKTWEIRAVGVVPDGGDHPLMDGWPQGGRPDAPKPYPW